MKLAKLVAAAALGVCIFAGYAEAQLKVVMNNDGSALSIKGKAMQIWKNEIEKRMGKDAQVELHNAGSLFDQKSQIAGVQLGEAHVIAPAIGIYTSIAPKISTLILPFLLQTPTQIQAAIDDPVIQKSFSADLDRRNIKLLAVWSNGPKDFFYRTNKPILVPEDMKGVKFRVQAVPADIEAMKVMGANPVAMTWTEVPTAFQQGVIDAIEPSPNAVISAGMAESIKHVTKIGYQYSFFVVGVSKSWWEGLSDQNRKALTASLAVATDWVNKNAALADADAYRILTEKGAVTHEITPEQRAMWTETVKPILKTFGSDLAGEAVIKRLKEIAATVK